ncbi:Fe-S-containing hydro-lyase [Aceticella autotrophica]|uniref:Fe-S-containing hydro-lyase n=1 Tax=Aceticella autotrophica TaxID=2755338 RepID=A0A975AV73_9THEO|nr:Fe-S-containing hydro-lyase [Aceticella autotrophica]QSZ27064.1 Fe-S-containing hydro-lyase [Aceticella autotrophica]
MGKIIKTPLTEDTVKDLKAGESLYITGKIYTARDAAHKRMIDTLNNGGNLPIDIKNQIIYYVGPCPAKPGHVVGSCGPTTSGRMDLYAPMLLKLGLKGMIGKGYRNKDVIDAIIKYHGVYFTTIGGAGALLAGKVKKARIIAYDDLGPEAIHEFVVEDFPVIVTIDMYGNNLYESEREKYRRNL